MPPRNNPDPLFDARASGDSYRGVGGYRNSADDADEVLSRIPIIGSGSRAALDARRAEGEADRNRAYWEQLTGYMPTADDLSVDYAGEDYVGGGDSAWNGYSREDQDGVAGMTGALDHMTAWAEGGFTEADRAMMSETARGEAMRARGDREATMSAMEARGMGGSGMDLISRLNADEAGAARASAANTTMMGAAQARQLEAARSMGDLGGRLAASDDARTNALDAWSSRETDYARGREGRNTNRENDSRESAANANQGAYENRERAVAGATGQYSTDVGRRTAENARADDADDDAAGLIGTVLENL